MVEAVGALFLCPGNEYIVALAAGRVDGSGRSRPAFAHSLLRQPQLPSLRQDGIWGLHANRQAPGFVPQRPARGSDLLFPRRSEHSRGHRPRAGKRHRVECGRGRAGRIQHGAGGFAPQYLRCGLLQAGLVRSASHHVPPGQRIRGAWRRFPDGNGEATVQVRLRVPRQ